MIIGEDEAAAWIRDGMTVSIGGFLNSSHPMPLVRAIIRNGIKNLTVVGAASAGLETDLLIAAGCVRRTVAYYVGGGGFGRAPWHRASGGPPNRGARSRCGSARRASSPPGCAPRRRGCRSCPGAAAWGCPSARRQPPTSSGYPGPDQGRDAAGGARHSVVDVAWILTPRSPTPTATCSTSAVRAGDRPVPPAGGRSHDRAGWRRSSRTRRCGPTRGPPRSPASTRWCGRRGARIRSPARPLKKGRRPHQGLRRGRDAADQGRQPCRARCVSECVRTEVARGVPDADRLRAHPVAV